MKRPILSAKFDPISEENKNLVRDRIKKSSPANLKNWNDVKHSIRKKA